ncbi:hypothetical protein NLL52_28250, partial [Klebsiella pneumoniae]|uniref:hypothetical protein n=1 Tax=Klebsiella pneumoniae TaxID=573 RepID=UPI0021CDF6B0
ESTGKGVDGYECEGSERGGIMDVFFSDKKNVYKGQISASVLLFALFQYSTPGRRQRIVHIY